MSTLPEGYRSLTEQDRATLLGLCSGRTGDSEAETALAYQNGDEFYRFSTGKGADAAAILRRNPGAVLGWRVWRFDDSTFTLFFLLDPDEVRGPGLWIKPARTEEQRAAQIERGRKLAGVAQ
tara:strand:- start:184 stop:549 length:366 start_codon:yes stop_codon:yes gene_type:complete